MGYTATLNNINRFGTSEPDCFALVIRLTRRDTRHFSPGSIKPTPILSKGLHTTEAVLEVGNPLIQSGIRHTEPFFTGFDTDTLPIFSDIISCSISKSKGTATGSLSMTLLPTQVNYYHALHPGDYICVWMKRKKVNLSTNDPFLYCNNKSDSGLKFFGIITNVGKEMGVDSNGNPTVVHKVSAKDFGYFFERELYYDSVYDELFNNSPFFKYCILSQTLLSYNNMSPDEIVRAFCGTLMGLDIELTKLDNDATITTLGGRKLTQNKAFHIPPQLNEIFSFSPASTNQSTIGDLLSYRIGVESYEFGILNTPVLFGMDGVKIFTSQFSSAGNIWNILMPNSNPMINEMFLDLKPSKINLIGNSDLTNVFSSVLSGGDEAGLPLYPTFVMRQIPFSTSDYEKAIRDSGSKMKVTRFIDLPRVKIDESFILSESLGRTESERVNLIEILSEDWGEATDSQVRSKALGNLAIDETSISRYGIHSKIKTTDYSRINVSDDGAYNFSNWIALLADWFLGAHLLESGTINTIGIEEPLSIGDNLEIIRNFKDDKDFNELYHIEGYTHSYTVSSDGDKSFRTQLMLTRGQLVNELPIFYKDTIEKDSSLPFGISQSQEAASSSVDISKKTYLTVGEFGDKLSGGNNKDKL